MTIVGAIIIAIGALAGIVLAATYADARLAKELRRQQEWFDQRQVREEERFEKQLARTAERFDDQLLTESVRLDRQLKHDREMRDRDELRKTLDEGARIIETAVSALHKLQVKTEEAIPDLPSEQERFATQEKERAEIRRQLLEAEDDLSIYARRLWLRIAGDHPLPEAATQVYERIGVATDIYAWVDRQDVTDGKRKEFQAAINSIAEVHMDFIGESRKLIGVKVSQ